MTIRDPQTSNQQGLAERLVAKRRRELPVESGESLTAYGTKLEMAAKLIAARDGHAAALRYLGDELVRAKDTPLRLRISKNINLMTLEGSSALPIGVSDTIGPKPRSLESLKGRPVLLFFWGHWCGSSRETGETLGRIWETYRGGPLALIAPTSYSGFVAEKGVTPAEERDEIVRAWHDSYDGLDDVPVVIDLDTMVRYGAASTPTFVLIDRKGIVRLYSPAGLPEEELSSRIDEVLAE